MLNNDPVEMAKQDVLLETLSYIAKEEARMDAVGGWSSAAGLNPLFNGVAARRTALSALKLAAIRALAPEGWQEPEIPTPTF